MTTIVGLHVPSLGTVIGNESRISDSRMKFDDQAEKWFFGDIWAVGVCGDLRGFNLVQQNIARLTHKLLEPVEFIARLKQLHEEVSYAPSSSSDGGHGCYPNGYLLANHLGVWEVEGDLALRQVPAHVLCAKGSGTMLAMAAGHARRTDADPVARVQAAIETAVHFDLDSGGPIWVGVIKPPVIEPKLQKRAKSPAKRAKALR